MKAVLPILTALAERAKQAEDIRRAKGRFTEVPEVRRPGPRPGTGSRTHVRPSQAMGASTTSEDEGFLPRPAMDRLQKP